MHTLRRLAHAPPAPHCELCGLPADAGDLGPLEDQGGAYLAHAPCAERPTRDTPVDSERPRATIFPPAHQPPTGA